MMASIILLEVTPKAVVSVCLSDPQLLQVILQVELRRKGTPARQEDSTKKIFGSGLTLDQVRVNLDSDEDSAQGDSCQFWIRVNFGSG
jgi:hypothetical protein